jgi:integrase
MHDIRHSDYVFPGGRDRRPLSETSLLMLLRRMGRADITAHGFRSTFRDWAAERTAFAREVAEMALAHAIPDAVEAAYRRGDLFDKRKKLMAAWAEYCGKVDTADAGKVVPITARKA